MLNKRTQTEIDNFFSKLYQLPEEIRQVTSSAFTQCRDKIKFTAFFTLNNSLIEFFYTNYHTKKYYGMRLVAIDGSVYTLPRTPDTIKEFGENVLSDSKKWIKAQVSFAADVLNNICVDSAIGAYRESECKQALSHLLKLGKGNLYLFDRGYFGRVFLKQVSGTDCQFCFRVQRNACSEVIEFIKSNLTDTIQHIDVNGEKIKVRLTKVLLDTGEEEYLITSLFDTRLFTVAKLKQLYHLRWGVEEQYKDMKYAICIENFIGKKVNSIKQEFFANILTYNLSMMACKSMIDEISNRKSKKYKYKTNKRAVLAKIKQCFVRLFFDTANICEILSGIIKSVAKESNPIRNDRKYIRGKTTKAKRKLYRAYVAVV